VVAVEGAAPVPELEAHANEKVDGAVYAVRFESTELWGDAASELSCVHVDLYEHYLEPTGA
jgi:nitrile hydratase